MPPEIDNSKPKEEAQPLIDFLAFHQGSTNNDGSSLPNKSSGKETSLEITDPYNLHQGLSSLARVLSQAPKAEGASERRSDTLDASAQKPASQSANSRPNPFSYHQGEKPGPKPETPAKPEDEPKPFVPPADVKPLPQTEKEAPKPTDQTSENKNANKEGKSPIVEAYERKQGARIAGNGNTLPAIDAIPGPNDLTPPAPGPNPNPQPNDFKPPWQQDKPKPDLPPWVAPDTKPDQPVKPVDYRPDPSDLISKLEPKYETKDVATAVKMAQETGLPLAVHIGAEWCGYCVQMERNTWPAVEGDGKTKGSMQGKVVVLHLDVDDQKGLRGESAKQAGEITKNRGSSIPILRVFKVDVGGKLTMTAENRGAINSKTQLENFLIKGGAKR